MYRKYGKRGGGGGGGGGAATVQRQVANERERKRMQTIGYAFEQLKKCIPWIPLDTKLSKADTLRLAALYMDYLSHILRQDLQAAELTAAVAMQKWPWQKTAFLFDEFECGRSVAHAPLPPQLPTQHPPPRALMSTAPPLPPPKVEASTVRQSCCGDEDPLSALRRLTDSIATRPPLLFPSV